MHGSKTEMCSSHCFFIWCEIYSLQRETIFTKNLQAAIIVFTHHNVFFSAMTIHSMQHGILHLINRYYLPCMMCADWKKRTLQPESGDVANQDTALDCSGKEQSLPLSSRKRVAVQCNAGSAWKKIGLANESSTVPTNKAKHTSSVATSWKSVGLCDEDGPCVSDAGSTTTPTTETTPVIVNLTLGLLQCMPNEALAKAQTHYAKQGSDKDRVSQVLKKGCMCSNHCIQNLNIQEIYPVVKQWHSLSTSSKVAILTALCSGPDGTPVTSRKQWSLQNKPLCFNAWCKVLGHCPRAVLKLSHGIHDGRSVAAVPRNAHQTLIINHFFMELYLGCAEDLPEKPVSCDVDKEIANAAETEVSTQFCRHFIWMLDAPVPERIGSLLRDPQAPARTLPPGHLSDLWHQFLSWCENQGRQKRSPVDKSHSDLYIPCWSTFYRTWTANWVRLLHFRKQSQHSECTICSRCRLAMHDKTLTSDERLQKAAEWRDHLLGQYHDRMLYWSLRYASRQFMNVLVLTIDSLDKSKMAYPQYAVRTPKDIDTLRRPRIVSKLQWYVAFCFNIMFHE